MAHDGNGTGWSETSPQDSEDIEDGALEIRDLRKALRIRAEYEHNTPAGSSVGMIHKTGSALAYYQSLAGPGAPTTDGKSTSLGNNNTSNGRLWINSDDSSLYFWNGSEWLYLNHDSGYVIAQDSPAANTSGGALSSGAWRQRNLNEEQGDTKSIINVTSNYILMQASSDGIWEIEASVPGYKVGFHRCRIKVETSTGDDTEIASLYGTTALADSSTEVMTRSEARGTLTLAAGRVIKIFQFVQTTNGTDGGGKASNLDSKEEIYTVVRMKRLKAT